MALHPGHSSVEEGLDGAAVEVPPDSFLGVVEEGDGLPGLRMGPPLAVGVDRPDVNPSLVRVQFDPFDGPRRDNPVASASPASGKGDAYLNPPPTEPREPILGMTDSRVL